jgi:hypothetical protein
VGDKERGRGREGERVSDHVRYQIEREMKIEKYYFQCLGHGLGVHHGLGHGLGVGTLGHGLMVYFHYDFFDG